MHKYGQRVSFWTIEHDVLWTDVRLTIVCPSV